MCKGFPSVSVNSKLSRKQMSFAAEPSNYLNRSVATTRRRHAFSHGAVAHAAAFSDFFVVLICSFVGVLSYHHVVFGLLTDPAMNVGVGLLTAAIFVLAMSCLHAYRYDALASVRHQALLIALVIPSVLAFLLAVIFFLKLGDTFSRGAVLNLAILSIVSLIGIRLLWHRRLSRAVSGGWLRPRRSFLICPENMPSDRIQTFSEAGAVKISQIAFVSDDVSSIDRLNERLPGTNSQQAIDEVIIVWNDAPMQKLENLLVQLRRLPLPVKVVFDSFAGAVVSCQAESFRGLVAFQVQSPPLVLVERVVKRAFDIAFSIFALALLSPMLLIVAVAIKLDSNGPVIFVQRRRGHANEPFRIFKFRSMSVLEDGDTIRQATKLDARVTRVGAFIRAYSIDELPQFWNVLIGDMSVVGPRPHAVAHDDVYDGLIAEYASRRHVKPGVTGWAQVQGFRGETPTIDLMEKRIQHDLWYMDNWSLWLDIKIVVRTMFALRGA